MTFDAPAGDPPYARSPEYDSGSAAFHAFSHASRNGWGALVAPGALYVVGYLAFSLLMLWSIWPFMEQLMSVDPQGEPDPSILIPFFTRFGIVMIVGLLGYLVIWSMVEAAVLRWLFGRGMRLRFGGVELMLIVIGIFWFVLPFAVFFLPWLLFFFAAGMESGAIGLLCALAFLAAIPVWIMLAVRLAPAGARTVHDGRMHLFSAWAVSQGCFWPVLGAFVIAALVYIGVSLALSIVQQVLFMLAGVSMFASMYPTMGAGAPPDPRVIIDAFTSPGMIAVFTVYSILTTIVTFLFQVMFAGVNAYGVKRLEAIRPREPYLP